MLFAKPVAVATDRDHCRMMKQAIKDRGCHHGIAKYAAPFPTERLEVIRFDPRSNAATPDVRHRRHVPWPASPRAWPP